MGGGQTEDWGVIQSLYKWVWLIEGASDPDWYTAGAQLIGEGGEWRREWRKKGKREYGPPEKMHLRCTTIDSTRIMPNVNTGERGHKLETVVLMLIVAPSFYSHLQEKSAAR